MFGSIPEGGHLPGEEHTNGERSIENGTSLIEGRFHDSRRIRAAYDSETERRKAVFQSEIVQLQEERAKAMALASDHAGNIGLIYRARTNTFSRVVIVDDLPSLAAERPRFPGADFTDSPPSSEVESERDSELSNDGPGRLEPEAASPSTSELAGEGFDSNGTKPSVATVDAGSRPNMPELPRRPSPPMPQQVDKKWERNTNIKSGVAWLASVFVGVFVGFGLLNLTGLPWQRASDWLNLYGFLTLGVAAIAAMKLLFDAMWHEAGRRKALEHSAAFYSVTCTVVSLVILTVEATLGGTALVYYTQRASYQNQGGLPIWQMILLAVAVSSANLLFSAFVGYQKGQRSVTHEDLLRRHHEIELQEHEQLVREAKEQHERDLKVWQEEVDRHEEIKRRLHEMKLDGMQDQRAAHEESLERWRAQVDSITTSHGEGLAERLSRLDEFESVRKLPDFQALCKCIGLIESLNLRIEELDRAATNESISRGHGRKSVM